MLHVNYISRKHEKKRKENLKDTKQTKMFSINVGVICSRNITAHH